MLRHPTIDKLQQLKLPAMARELAEHRALPETAALGFEERLGLLADRELTERSNRRLALRLRQAKLRQSAALEDLDTRAPRGLDKALIVLLATCQWIAEHLNCLISGPPVSARPGWLVPWPSKPPTGLQRALRASAKTAHRAGPRTGRRTLSQAHEGPGQDRGPHP